MNQFVHEVLRVQPFKGLNIFLILGSLQQSMYIIFPNYLSNSNPHWLLCLIRPDLVLFQYAPQWKYSSLLAMSIIVIDKFILISRIFFRSRNQILSLYLSIYSNIFLIYLYQLLATLCVQTIIVVFNLELNYGYLGLSFFLLCFILIEAAIRLQFSETYTLKIQGVETLIVGLLEYFDQLLILIQMIVYAMSHVELANLFQFLLLIVILIVRIYQQITFRSYIRDDHILINISCLSLNLSLCFGLILDQFIYGVLIFPLILKLFYEQAYNYFDKILLFPQQQSNHILKMIYQINNSQITLIRKYVIRATHIKFCIDQYCQCRIQETYQDNAPLTLRMYEEYQLCQIEQVGSIQNSPYTNYWFPALLFQIGYPSLALKEISRLVNKLPKTKQFTYQYRSQASLIKSLYSFSQQLSQQLEYQPKRKVETSISSFEKAIGNHFKQLILEQIQKGYKIQHGNVIVLAVAQFQQNELNTLKFHKDVIQIITEKVNFYYWLISNNPIQGIYTKSLILSKKLHIIEEQLKQQFEKFPTKRNQCLLCFYQAEILNNIQDAYKNSHLNSLQEDGLILLQNNIDINLFQSNISYIQCTINDQIQNFDITQVGSSFQLNYPQIPEVTFDKIMPRYIREHHQILVELFLTQGKSRFYYQFSLSFIQVDDLFVEPINMCVSNLINTENLQFMVFIQGIFSNIGYIIIDTVGIIQNYTAAIFKQINYSSETIKAMRQNSNLFRFPISDIIMQFETIKTIDQHIQAELKFLKEDSIYSYCNTKQLPTHSFETYRGNIKIERKELFRIYYYIIEVQNLYQYVDNSIGGTIVEIDQSLDLTEDMAQTAHQLSPKLIQDYLEILSPRMDLPLNSANRSYKGLLLQKIYFDNQGNNYVNIPDQQQNYFNDSNLLVNKSDSKAEMKSQSLKLQQVQMINDMSSNDSTRTGLRKSIYYQKLDLIDKISQQGVSMVLIKLISIYVFAQCIQLLYGAILIVLSYTDISTFGTEIRIIGYHADIMGPQDIYYLKRLTIITYQNYLTAGIINATQYTNLTDPCYADIMNAYYETLSSFYEIFSNSEIQNFIIGNKVDLILMNYNQSFLYNISMSQSEEYYVVLQYVYALTQIYMKRQSTSGTPAQTMQKANYYAQHTQLEEMTLLMKQFSIDRASNVASKWQFILILSLIMLFIINAFTMYLYNELLKYYDKHLNLFYLLDNNIIQIDIDRQKLMVKSLLNNSSIFQTYQFLLSNLDNSIYSQKKQSAARTKQKRQQSKLSRIKGYILISILYALFTIYTIVSNNIVQTYLTKYKSTTTLYNLFQNLKYASGNIYTYRETAYRWSSFPFYTQQNWESNNKLIDNSLTLMSQFMDLQSSVQFSNYLINQDFIDYFNRLKSIPLCPELDPKYLVFLNRYCNISLSGVLQTGLTQSLNYLINAIQTQRQINNFTIRLEFGFYELEGSQVITRTFQTMSDYYKQIVLTITNHNINAVQSLSLSCIIISIAAIVFVLLYLYKQIKYSYFLIKRLVYLFPQSFLLSDETLERQLRMIAINLD